MKIAISVESAGVHSALRDSIASSSSTAQDNENITNKIIAIAKKILLTKIEYEEVNNYDQSVLDTFKSKYTVLKPFNSGKLITSQGESITNNVEKNCNQKSSVPQQNHSYQNNLKTSNELPQPKRILFPRDSVQIGWRSSGRKWQVGAGMMNVGNTCYLNSTLQALFHVPAMANWLISDSDHREECRSENGLQDGCIICAMAKTFISSQVSSSAIRPQLVYSRLKQICKHLIFGRQEDAHEFLRYLVEAMEKSYLQRFKNYKELDQYSKETTPLNQILGGYLKTSVRCLSCGHVSTTFQHFQDLLLDIRKPNTIEEALDGYFAKERLEDMGYKCESCKKKVSAIKQFSLERAPISLCIQLKRFSMVGTKINKYIAIRPRLDLTKFATNKGGGETFSYKLVAMVTHLGASQHCGHYTAIGLTEQGGYYQFDDSCVRPISLPNVLNTNAYIIFYELDENQQSKPVCTQISGENEILKNEICKHSENIMTPQQKNLGNGIIVNNEKNSNSLFSSSFIGPLLPTDKVNNFNASTDCSGCKDAKTGITNQNAKFNENTAPSNKYSTSPGKLLIHFKSSSSSSNGTLNSLIEKENITQDLGDSSKLESDLTKSFNDKYKCKDSVESKLVKNAPISENILKKEESQYDDEDKKLSILPSMPKLDSNFENGNTLTLTNSSNQNNKTPTKQNIPWAGPLSPNYLMRQISNDNNISKVSSIYNGVKESPIKSLVPYGSDADEDSNDSSDNGIKNIKKEINEDNCNNTPFDKQNGENEKGEVSTSNETTPDASPDFKENNKSNPPSPHVVKTKAGLWQVTPITPNGSPKAAEIEIKEEIPKKVLSNPFNTNGNPIPTTIFYSDKTHCNSQDNYMKNKDDKNPTVKELTKFSHRGYGTSVLSWNGTKSEMEIVVNDEVRQERKRQIQDDEENDVDRGRQKKIKNNGYSRKNDSNPGFNPFQEQQLQKNNDQIRQNWIAPNNNNNSNNNNNRNSNKLNNSIRYHYQNNFNNSYNFDTSNNNNDSINFLNKISNGKNNSNNNNKINKFNIANKSNNNINSINNNNNRNNSSNKNNSNKNNNKTNNSNNNCFRNDINSNTNTNNNTGSHKSTYNQHNSFLNRNHNNGNSNFFRRHNSKKFNNSNQRLIHLHQKSGEWR